LVWLITRLSEVFFESFFYWKTNIIRHNLDVMHIKKNMFENIFNIVIDMKWKTK
jgi:hypothetical protein